LFENILNAVFQKFRISDVSLIIIQWEFFLKIKITTEKRLQEIMDRQDLLGFSIKMSSANILFYLNSVIMSDIFGNAENYEMGDSILLAKWNKRTELSTD